MVQFQAYAGPVRARGARQIYEAIRDQIVAGVFGSDGALPSSRSLAAEIGVSRTTVTVAYEQLQAEGYIAVRRGARPRVAIASRPCGVADPGERRTGPARLSAFGDRVRAIPVWQDYGDDGHLIDFRYGDLSPADFPIGLWKRAVAATAAPRPTRLAYYDPRGSRRLRMALQGYLWRARAIRCDLDQIIIVNGSQQGLDLCARLFLDPTDRFVIENPCYAMARQVFAMTGAAPVPTPVDSAGLLTTSLSGVRGRLAYVTPSHQFPIGGVMSVSRRLELLEWARREQAHVIEDDYDSEYRYDINPVPPLHVLGDGESVVYLGTISKTLSPTLRIGYLVVPPVLQLAFATAKQLTDRHSPVADQEALAAIIESGAYERHIRRMRRLNGERRRILLSSLQATFGTNVIVEGADAGLHVVVKFTRIPRHLEGDLIEQGRSLGVGLHSTAHLYDPSAPEAIPDCASLVMGYSALDLRHIERGIQLLAQAVRRIRPSE